LADLGGTPCGKVRVRKGYLKSWGLFDMAIRGRKPKATAIRKVLGNPSGRPYPSNEPKPAAGCVKPPQPLKGRPLALWRKFIVPAWWLTDFDAPKGWLWVHLHAEAEKDPAAMTAARISQLRALGSELGFDPASRTRMGGDKRIAGDPLDEFF
jgi:hypothetical protein